MKWSELVYAWELPIMDRTWKCWISYQDSQRQRAIIFVSVTKSDEGDWEVLDMKTREALKEHVNSGEPAVNPLSLEKPASAIREGETELDRKIRDVLDRDIRPAVAMDGGDVVFEKFENGVVYLYMQGACAGCPSSTATLKMGIETRIKAAVPEVSEVVAL